MFLSHFGVAALGVCFGWYVVCASLYPGVCICVKVFVWCWVYIWCRIACVVGLGWRVHG